MTRGETMTNNIKLGTLIKFSAIPCFYLHDAQYGILEVYTKSQIMKNKQLLKMKVIQFKIFNKNSLLIDIEE